MQCTVGQSGGRTDAASTAEEVTRGIMGSSQWNISRQISMPRCHYLLGVESKECSLWSHSYMLNDERIEGARRDKHSINNSNELVTLLIAQENACYWRSSVDDSLARLFCNIIRSISKVVPCTIRILARYSHPYSFYQCCPPVITSRLDECILPMI